MAAPCPRSIVGLAGIGTAVVLFPVLRRQSETAALGFVAARVVETSLIFVGVVSLLTIITLRNDVAGTAGADPASLVTTGHTLVAVYNWTFLLSQSLMPVIVDLLLGYLLYRSRLVPRILPIIAFVGAPLLLASDIAIFFGAYDQGVPARRPRRAPDRRLRVLLRHLADRQGLQPGLPSADPATADAGTPGTSGPIPSPEDRRRGARRAGAPTSADGRRRSGAATGCRAGT